MMFVSRHKSWSVLTYIQAQCKSASPYNANLNHLKVFLGCYHRRNLNESSTVGQQNRAIKVSNTDLESGAKLSPDAAVPFAHAKLGSFTQEEQRLGNQFTQDALLQGFLQRHVPSEHLQKMTGNLEKFGERVTGDIYQLSLRMEAEPPKLEQMNAWGCRVDRLITSTAWQEMKSISAQEGLIASAYEREFSQWSRLYQMCQFYLFEPSGGLYGCPLAMTNGAARTVELLKDAQPWLYDQAFPHLTSRDPDQFWTSGQWMTEKRGGSDVAGGTETMAVEQNDGSYRLYGYKWFSSATDADITLTLARIVDKYGNTVKGTRGLSLFFLDVKGQGSHIQLVKLKNKLGTRQLPTAELLIDGATAYKISDEGRGIASMSEMLTLTRIHTATHAAGAMRRIVNLARDYACRRQAFGRHLRDHPLHMHTLTNMEVQTRAAAIFVLEVARLLGRQETLEPDENLAREKNVLRLVVPLLKLYVSKKSVAVVSEGLECFGGQGYIEDTDLPRLLRDTQVTPIWEGTTNILSLDMLRAIRKSPTVSSISPSPTAIPSVLRDFQLDVLARISPARELLSLQICADRLEASLLTALERWEQLEPWQQEMAAREMAFSLARIYMGALLTEHASHNLATEADVYTAQRWCETDLAPLVSRADTNSFTPDAQDLNMQLVYESYPQ